MRVEIWYHLIYMVCKHISKFNKLTKLQLRAGNLPENTTLQAKWANDGNGELFWCCLTETLICLYKPFKCCIVCKRV